MLFSQVFHIVHVQTHHVAGAARENQGVGAALGNVARIAFHEAQVHHAFGNDFGCGKVRVAVRVAGPKLVHGRLEAAKMQIIDILLPGSEALANRH